MSRKKLLVPAQYFGIGDVIFCMTLIRRLAGDKYKILWPVMSRYVEGLNRAYPDVTFVAHDMIGVNYEERKDVEYETYRYVPIRWADTILKVPYTQCMSSKYHLYNMDYIDWKKDGAIHRDVDIEKELFYEVLGLKDGYQYNLVSHTFGSNFNREVPIKIDNGYKNVEMRHIEGYSIFDWMMVMERALHIHAVSSSILYLLEMMALSSESIHLYPRMPIENDFRNVDYLFTKPYIIH